VGAIARAVGTAGAKAIASITNATAEIVIAILLNMTHPSRQTHTFIATDTSRQSDHHHRRWLFIFGGPPRFLIANSSYTEEFATKFAQHWRCRLDQPMNWQRRFGVR
jgi:hypothetical protein